MSRKLMNFKFQVSSENTTQQITLSKLPTWFLKFPSLLNSLFEVGYFIGTSKDATSPEGHFYTLGYNNLIQFPYTIRATSILVETGFYSESIVLIRNLYESFFQLRYFYNHQDKLMAHWKNKSRVRLKTMFEEIAPNFYEQIYGKQFSEFAHSGIASSIFRTKYDSSEEGKTRMGCEYDEAGCGYVINKIIVVLFGILNYVPILFPQYPNLVTEEIEAKRKDSLEWLNFVMKSHATEKPDSKIFYDLVSPLIHIAQLDNSLPTYSPAKEHFAFVKMILHNLDLEISCQDLEK
jgi:hypothetical protein